jgi:hypothetical protein
MIKVIKLSLSSLVLQGGIKEVSEKTKSFFKLKIREPSEPDHQIVDGVITKNICVYEYTKECVFNMITSQNYIVMINGANQMMVYYLSDDDIYLVDEVFDSYQILYFNYIQPESGFVEKSLLLSKDNTWYLLDCAKVENLGTQLVDNAFYNSETKQLSLLGLGLDTYCDIENLSFHYENNRACVTFEMDGKKYKKIYCWRNWFTPFFWWLFKKNK